MSALAAHEASNLLHLIRGLEGHPTQEVAQLVAQELSLMHLATDVEAVIVFSDGHSIVNFEPVTPLGHDLLEELVSSAEYVPCPPDSCELKHGRCIWCGSTRIGTV